MQKQRFATVSLSLIKDAETLALSRYGSSYSSTSQFSTALALATTLLTDFSITSSLPTSLPPLISSPTAIILPSFAYYLLMEL